MEHEWYVLKTKPRQERAVQSWLDWYGVEVYAPEIAVAKKGIQRCEILFPTYVFCNLTCDEQWPLVRWSRGVRYVVGTDGHPASLDSSVIDQIKGRVEWWNDSGWREHRAGEQVRISSGPLSGLDAIFQGYVPGKQRCQVLISLMYRPLTVEVDLLCLARVM